jgi:hypothetical protein
MVTSSAFARINCWPSKKEKLTAQPSKMFTDSVSCQPETRVRHLRSVAPPSSRSRSRPTNFVTVGDRHGISNNHGQLTEQICRALSYVYDAIRLSSFKIKAQTIENLRPDLLKTDIG